VSEPEAVTESAAVFVNQEPEEVAAVPGDAPVAGEDETLESGGPPPLRVQDDPYGGVPIETAPAEEARGD
jgi:hypothetical protein